MSTLRLAVVGCGHLGSIHARLANELPDVDFVAVSDPVEENCHRVAESCGVRAVSDFRELVDQVDAAIVATPTSCHHEVGGFLLDHGIHTLIEKPLAADSAQARQLVSLADTKERVLQVGHVERFNPAYAAVAHNLSRPQAIVAQRQAPFPFRALDVSVILDLMIHDLDIVLAQMNSPVSRVEAMGQRVLSHNIDFATAWLEFENGGVAQLTASRVADAPVRSMRFYTDDEIATVDFGARSASVLKPAEGARDKFGVAVARSSDELKSLRETLFQETHIKTEMEVADANPLLDEQRDFIAAIKQQRQPRVDGRAGHAALELAEEIEYSVNRRAGLKTFATRFTLPLDQSRPAA